MRGMSPDDVFALRSVADLRVAPDGVHVAYVVTSVDRDANDYAGAIWLATLDGSAEPRQLTLGVKQDAESRWSPDGARLAFTSNRDGKTMQLYVLPVSGGAASPYRPERGRDPAGVGARRIDDRLRLARARRRLR